MTIVSTASSSVAARRLKLNGPDGHADMQLVTRLEMTRQAVTQHLNVLEAADLVVSSWRGRQKLHFPNPVPLQEIYDRWISSFERSRARVLRDLKQRLEGTSAWVPHSRMPSTCGTRGKGLEGICSMAREEHSQWLPMTI